MGRIRDFFNRIMRRRETRLLESTTQKEIKKFIDKIHQNENDRMNASMNDMSRDTTKEFYKSGVEIVNDFISLVNDGKVDIGGDPSHSIYKRMLKYFNYDTTVCNMVMEIVNKEFYDAIEKASNGETYDQVHAALDKTLAEYLKTIGSDKKIERLFEIGKVNQIQEVLRKSVLLVDDAIEVISLSNKIAEIYEGTLLYQIRKEKDINKQIELYDEYIRDFRNGKEIDIEKDRDYLDNSTLEISQMKFIQVREVRKAYREYGIPAAAKVTRIYKTDKYKTTRDRNERICNEHIEAGKVETSDLALVRTTKMFPHNGIVETTDKHSDLIEKETPFKRELEELGVADLEKYKMLIFQNRRTVHFTLNGLVGSHEYGNFEGRNFIIIEPFEEHRDDKGLLNINEADTYFDEDVVLSKRASILIPVEKYKELIKDEKTLKELNQYDIRLFDGNEEEAVRMCLLDKGYSYGVIHKWGFEHYYASKESQDLNENLIEKCEEKIAEELREEGKEVTYGGVHFYSESKKIDDERSKELTSYQYKILVECIADTCKFEFSKTALMNELLSREFLPKEAKFEDGDLDKPKLEPKEILERLTPEGLELVTQKYNKIISIEHEEARIAKDKELKQKGLIVEETKLETKEDRDGK